MSLRESVGAAGAGTTWPSNLLPPDAPASGLSGRSLSCRVVNGAGGAAGTALILSSSSFFISIGAPEAIASLASFSVAWRASPFSVRAWGWVWAPSRSITPSLSGADAKANAARDCQKAPPSRVTILPTCTRVSRSAATAVICAARIRISPLKNEISPPLGAGTLLRKRLTILCSKAGSALSLASVFSSS